MFKSLKGIIFNRIGWHLAEMHTSPRLLDLRRFKRRAIESALEVATRKHPTAKLFVLTDDPRQQWFGKNVTVMSSLRDLELVGKNSVVILAFQSDEDAMEAVRLINAKPGVFYFGANQCTPTARTFHRDEAMREALKESLAKSMGKWELMDFENIAQALRNTRHLAGDYVEIGVYKGESARFALNYMERIGLKRKSWFIDTFGGFNYEESEKSKDGVWTETHSDSSVQAVEKLLSDYKSDWNVLRSNVITDDLPTQQIAVANIDVDMYEAVLAALNKCAPLIIPGGIMISEDQGHTPLLIGAYVATMEFLQSEPGKSFTPIEMTSGQMFLVKTGASR